MVTIYILKNIKTGTSKISKINTSSTKVTQFAKGLTKSDTNSVIQNRNEL